MSWIKSSIKLPEKDGRYLVIENHYSNWRGVASFRNGTFETETLYWQEIPELPDELK